MYGARDGGQVSGAMGGSTMQHPRLYSEELHQGVHEGGHLLLGLQCCSYLDDTVCTSSDIPPPPKLSPGRRRHPIEVFESHDLVLASVRLAKWPHTSKRCLANSNQGIWRTMCRVSKEPGFCNDVFHDFFVSQA
ncbi:hypothetical protein F441_20287 [Phytophthora nicotianae CJ01A1]|uniref:Uncharacterized protein n=6 Tax=Phytophthora nicotianae TaxID=4792 RepID=V9E3J8_PHYNI|nr:hypothetical protein F443_20407 [Phytophthora nicotianae P1569]ETL26634.1 hypothetical protein L916_19730 [Phytophthora nicotianae]ETO61595.1 hypothetical protein F444_20420 [Phytophthora nicotianae P1976]ETP02696.1 hypothetical protein F441_20287 [Phytophthora nicotianae CJ01A1]ETP30865.1 hypothetical protein F442_20215 [Phytophthora nicotianae P10297]